MKVTKVNLTLDKKHENKLAFGSIVLDDSFVISFLNDMANQSVTD